MDKTLHTVDECELRYKVMLVTLLHDVGKIIQRAGKESELDNLCKLDKEGFYRHDELSCSFIERYLGKDYAELFKNKEWHVGDVASATERVPEESSTEVAKTPLLFPGADEKDDKWYPVTYVDYRATVETYKMRSKNEAQSRINYPGIYEKLLELADKAKNIKDPKSLLETYDYIYRTVALLVPSAVYRTKPDISLYAHSRIAAAFSKFDTFKLVLIDLKGIQKFITNITREAEASKRLRGRSFFLQLLQMALVDRIGEELCLSFVNNLSFEPGKIILPVYDDKSVEKIRDILLDLSKWSEYELQFAMASSSSYETSKLTFTEDVSKDKKDKVNYYEIIEKLFDKLSIVGSPIIYGVQQGGSKGGEGAIAYTDFFYTQSTKMVRQRDDFSKLIPGEEVSQVSLLNFISLIIGHSTRNLKYVVEVIYDKPNAGQNAYHDEGFGEIYIEPLNVGFFLIHGDSEEDKLLKAIRKVKSKAKRIRILKVNDSLDFINEKVLSEFDKVSFGYIPISTYHSVDQSGRFISLDDIPGYIGLGVIDGDGIGSIILELRTPGRIATFSLLMDFTFSHIVVEFVDERTNNKNQQAGPNVILLYSGGDDLAIYGKWDEVLDLLVNLEENIKQILPITVSGGFYVFKAKYPIYWVYFEAREFEDSAKSARKKLQISEGLSDNNNSSYCTSTSEKYLEGLLDSNIFEKYPVNGTLVSALKWEEVKEFLGSARDLNKQAVVSSSYLYKLYQIGSMAEEGINNETQKARALVTYAYLNARMKDYYEKASKIIKELPDFPNEKSGEGTLNQLMKLRTVINMYSLLSRE